MNKQDVVKPQKSLVIVISGVGSNMVALAEAAEREDWAGRWQAQIAAVISNRPQAAGLIAAQRLGLPTRVVDHTRFVDREAFDAALFAEIESLDPALILLAGFMRVLGEAVVSRNQHRLLNIHPSLLPAFAGLHTHQRALDAGCRFVGCTVHRVTPVLDHGPILGQAVAPVLPTDDAASLARRVQALEYQLYPQVVRQLLQQNS